MTEYEHKLSDRIQRNRRTRRKAKQSEASDEIKAKQVTKMANANYAECPICCEEICRSYNYLMTCCGHQFHHSCFKTAFETCSTTCPMCRQDVHEVHICDNNVVRTVPNTYSKPPTDFDTIMLNFGELSAVAHTWVDITQPYARFALDEDYFDDVDEDYVDENMDVDEDYLDEHMDVDENMDVDEENVDWVDNLVNEENENVVVDNVSNNDMVWDEEVLDILLAECVLEEETETEPVFQETHNVGVY